jgi:hypothetical protein
MVPRKNVLNFGVRVPLVSYLTSTLKGKYAIMLFIKEGEL